MFPLRTPLQVEWLISRQLAVLIVEVLLRNITAFGSWMAMDFWRFINQTGTDLVVSIIQAEKGESSFAPSRRCWPLYMIKWIGLDVTSACLCLVASHLTCWIRHSNEQFKSTPLWLARTEHAHQVILHWHLHPLFTRVGVTPIKRVEGGRSSGSGQGI